MTGHRLVPFALALVVFSATSAQALDPTHHLSDYSLTNWSESSGPFPFGVYAIAQDQAGYLWIGTRTGLVRFDGTSFSLWEGSAPLSDDRISAIEAARDGSLWLGYGTMGGVTRIRDGRAETFGPSDGLTPGDVRALLEDQDGAIWAATDGGLSRFADGRWKAFGAAQGLPSEPILGLFKDSRGDLWAGTSIGVYRSAPGHERFTFVSPSITSDFAEDASGTVWGTDRDEGFTALDGLLKERRKALSWNGALGRVLLHDRSGSLWVGTRGNGLMRIRGLDGATTEVSTERLTRREGLASNEIRAIFEDRDGTLWIATRLGLSRLSERTIQAPFNDPSEDAFVAAVTRTKDGSVWTGTARGLRRRLHGHEESYGVKEGLPGQIVTALHEDRNGTLWVATTRGVAKLVDGRFDPLPVSDLRLPNVLSMATDQEGSLWLCDTVIGVVRWSGGRLVRMNEAFKDGHPYFAFADSADRVWIGFWSGSLVAYRDGVLQSYSVADGLPGGTPNLVYEDRTGAIWVGTSKGLARFENGRFTTYFAKGFPRSAVVSIVEDSADGLWFGLASGLVHIQRAEFDRVTRESGSPLKYKVYGTDDGLPGTLGRPGMPSSTRDDDGKLWFVTSVGLAVVDPLRAVVSPAAGPIRIEDLVVDGRVVEPAAGLRLGPNASRIQIEYSILSLSAATKAGFRYRLDPFDNDWQDAGDRRQASYTNLPPGSYVFQVASNSNDGGWNPASPAFAFSIRSAFYQTTTFYVVVLTSIAFTIWSVWRLHLRRIRQEYDLVLAERARMGREIHDTLLQSLVGVALEFDDISSQLEPSAHALKKQVSRIREQVEHYIREARQSIWNLRSPALQTTDLPTALRHSGQLATAGNQVRFEFALNGRPRRVPVRVEEQLLRIGQEALSNAVRHSAADVVRADLTYDEEGVRLRVSDNGCGFDPVHIEHSEGHWGVTSMRERAQQIGARFNVISTPGGGTTVDAVAPCSAGSEAP